MVSFSHQFSTDSYAQTVPVFHKNENIFDMRRVVTTEITQWRQEKRWTGDVVAWVLDTISRQVARFASVSLRLRGARRAAMATDGWVARACC